MIRRPGIFSCQVLRSSRPVRSATNVSSAGSPSWLIPPVQAALQRGRTSRGAPVRRLALDTMTSTGASPISPVTPRRASALHPKPVHRRPGSPAIAGQARTGAAPGTGVTHRHHRQPCPTADPSYAKPLKSVALGRGVAGTGGGAPLVALVWCRAFQGNLRDSDLEYAA